MFTNVADMACHAISATLIQYHIPHERMAEQPSCDQFECYPNSTSIAPKERSLSDHKCKSPVASPPPSILLLLLLVGRFPNDRKCHPIRAMINHVLSFPNAVWHCGHPPPPPSPQPARVPTLISRGHYLHFASTVLRVPRHTQITVSSKTCCHQHKPRSGLAAQPSCSWPCTMPQPLRRNATERLSFRLSPGRPYDKPPLFITVRHGHSL